MKKRTSAFVSLAVFSIASCSLVVLGTPAFAQGSFVTYGSGCPGSTSAMCTASNGNTTQTPPNIHNQYTFAVQVPASPQATLVDGFEFWTKATIGAGTVSTALYTSSGGKPSTILATGTMTIGTTLAWYRTTFARPVSIPANTAYWLSWAPNTQLLFPFVSSGTLGTHCYRVSSTSSWNGPWTSVAWAWRVNCRQVPQIGCTGVPTIGKTHTLTLSGAKTNAPAFLAIGLQRLNPPFAFPGAPSCFLHTDVLALVALKTDAKGSIQFPEKVPDKAKLKGLKITQQFAVVDPVNTAQLVFSAGSEIRL